MYSTNWLITNGEGKFDEQLKGIRRNCKLLKIEYFQLYFHKQIFKEVPWALVTVLFSYAHSVTVSSI